MLILAIDTTAVTATTAIVENGRLRASFTLNSGNTHSVTVLPMIERMLDCLKIGCPDIDLFAVSAGPGSFTGVRIGTAAIKGLAFAENIPCIGVSTLEALAYNLSGFSGIVCPVMNARRSQVYTAIFRSSDDGITRLTPDGVMPVSGLSDVLKQYSEPIYFTGDGYNLAIAENSLTNVKNTPEQLKYQNAASVALLAENIWGTLSDAQKSASTPEALKCIYLRRPQAERERDEKESKTAHRPQAERE